MGAIRILAIDGGGIRGILPGQILVSLEKKLQVKSGNPNARIAEYFDMLAGTSTGGILTCIYLCPDSTGKPRFTAQDAVDLYLKQGSQIFHADIKQKIISLGGLSDEKYPVKNLESDLKQYFGDIKLSELLKPCVITSYNIYQRYAHFFRSHRAKKEIAHDFYVRDVARSTSAAPTYFQPAMVSSLDGVSYPLVDGGVFANNPALCAFAEAIQHFKLGKYDENKDGRVTVEDMYLVSIGTGLKNGLEFPQYEYDKAKHWGLIGWARPVLDIMMAGVNETVDYQLRQMFDSVGKHDHYYRLMPNIQRATTDMDDASAKNLQFLKEDGIEAAQEFDSQLEKIASFLTGKGSSVIA